MKIELKPIEEVTREAIRLLYKELGPVNAIRFLNQLSPGKGNYTEERKELFKGMTSYDIIRDIKKFQADQRNEKQ